MNKDQIIPLLILLILFIFGLLFLPISRKIPTEVSSTRSLQLGTIKWPKPTISPKISTPTTTTFCAADYKINAGSIVTCLDVKSCSKCPAGTAKVLCNFKNCVAEDRSGHPSLSKVNLPNDKHPGSACSNFGENQCSECGLENGIICWDKPVIYLYPESKVSVDVEVVTDGKIVVSDPHYPAGGWKNVIAEPSGTIFYQGKKYSQLYYETSVQDNGEIKNGIIISSNNLDPKLDEIITRLGLTGREKEEFLDYWLPRLHGLGSKYILFSLIDSETKNMHDKLIINPEPETRIEFIAYFKPLNKPIDISELKLTEPPVRRGFTIVEWGGTIDLKDR